MNWIDPGSPVPLYQIAQLIRERIESGELACGDILDPLREAAQEWQVNFHTVRHAYAELARDGLVEMRGPRGTRVVGAAGKIPTPGRQREQLDSFLTEVLQRAGREYGLSPLELTELIASREGLAKTARPRVHVLECSQHQCEDLSRQLEAIWKVDAIPFCLDGKEDLPAQDLVATHFHYNEIRLRWPRRLAEVSFVSIFPPRDLWTEIKKRAGGNFRLTVCERDQPTAEAVAADISALLPVEYPIHTRVINPPEDILKRSQGELLLISPRVWGSLSDEQRQSERAIEVRYLYDPEELEETARRLGWTAQTAPGLGSGGRQQ
ncbi:MAG: GntR family transcriptional regulator [Acidobacteriota bacterium]